MAIGDAALAAGMDILTGNELANTLDTEENKTRDYIAQRWSAVTPVTKGGTGATTADGARTALGVPATGAVCLRNGLGFTRAVAQLTDTDLGMYWNPEAQRYVMRGGAGGDTALATEAMIGPAVSNKVDRSGDTITGNLYLPNTSPANVNYAVCYLNGDGRVSRGASSERFKKHISQIDPASMGNIFPDLYRFQMKGGLVGAWKYGNIAERVAENPDTEPFVIYDQEGRPETLDFIALLQAQVAALHQRVTELEAAR